MSSLTEEKLSERDGVADHSKEINFFLLEGDNSGHFKTNLFIF